MATSPTLAECRKLLDVEPGASPDELRKAYLRMEMLWHPDRFAEGSELQREAQERIKLIHEAYALLKGQPSSPQAPAPRPAPRPSPGPQARAAEPAAAPDPSARRISWPRVALATGVFSVVGLLYLVSRRPPLPPPRTVAPPQEPPPAAREPAPAVPVAARPQRVFQVDRPGLIIHGPVRPDIDVAVGEAREAMEAFAAYAAAFEEQLRAKRPDIAIIHTDADVILFGDSRHVRKGPRDCGFILQGGGRAPILVEGSRLGTSLLALVQDYFPESAIPAPASP